VDGRGYGKVVSAEKENGDNFGSEGVFPFWIVIEETDKDPSDWTYCFSLKMES
jgi:hypothetical protein